MSVISGYSSLSTSFESVVPTTAATDDSLRFREIGHRVTWQRATDVLLGWLSHPETLDDDEIDPPSAEIIKKTLDVVRSYQRQNYPLPDRFGTTVEGGISFEWDIGPFMHRVALLNNGTIETNVFDGNGLVHTLTQKLGW